jgi:threonine/homoserine/homoserine lactone efflux protein
MRSVPEFLIIAVLVTLTPGPGTATILRVAARDGRRAAMSGIVGNSAGVLVWGTLSAVAVLIVIGLRSFLQRHRGEEPPNVNVPGEGVSRRRAGWRAGLVTSMSNPKLAVFFVALFPQFLTRGSPVLPYALGIAGAIVLLDVLWFSTLAYALAEPVSCSSPGYSAA